MIGVAAVLSEVAPAVAEAEIEPAVRTHDQTAADVIVVRRYTLKSFCGRAKCAAALVVPVSAKGIDSKTGRPIVNPEAYYGADPIQISPGGGGARNWSPMSYNPMTGLACQSRICKRVTDGAD